MKLDLAFALALLLAFEVSPVESLDPIVVRGNMLFNARTEERFFIKGITFGYETDVSFETSWKPAIDKIASEMSSVNTIRIYAVHPPVNVGDFHDDTNYSPFMEYAASKGLYVIVPLTPRGQEMSPLHKNTWEYCTLSAGGDPEWNPITEHTCYPVCLMTYAQSVMNHFSKFENTLMYVIGNEVLLHSGDWKNWEAAPCLKGFVRDVKIYMKTCGAHMRRVPTAYAAADAPSLDCWDGTKADESDYKCKDGTPTRTAGENLRAKADFLIAGTGVHNNGQFYDDDTGIDIMSVNIYRWCSPDATFEATYKRVYEQVKNLSVPLFFAEFGCDNFYVKGRIGQRDWKSVRAIYGPDMNDAWSGGAAYSYSKTGGSKFAMFLVKGCQPSNDDKCIKAMTDGALCQDEWFTNNCKYECDVCKGRHSWDQPGLEKVCGYPNETCNADNYARELSKIDPTLTPLEGGICAGLPKDYNTTRRIAPFPTQARLEELYRWIEKFGVSEVWSQPRTADNEHFKPYMVPCTTHTLSLVDEALRACGDRTHAPSHSPSPSHSMTSSTSESPHKVPATSRPSNTNLDEGGDNGGHTVHWYVYVGILAGVLFVSIMGWYAFGYCKNKLQQRTESDAAGHQLHARDTYQPPTVQQ